MANLYVAQAYLKAKEDPSQGYDVTPVSTAPDTKIFDFNNGIIGNDQQKYSIYYLGIQSFAGLIFNINSNKTTAESTIRLGQTGIFELNLFDSSPIEKIKFENLNDLAKSGMSTDYCLIDLIYEINE